jgi:predicted AAA+ superfamily ATPase
METDPQWRAFRDSRLRWQPKILQKLDLQKEGVYTLRGPRQVGKTTLIKIWISQLLENHVDPRAVFYYSCDLLNDKKELFAVLEQYQNISLNRGFKHRYIFLDEVTLIEDWQHAVKQAVDLGWMQNTTILASGSSAIDLRRGAERMPGRRGRAEKLDWVLMPLSFGEFLKYCYPELPTLTISLDLLCNGVQIKNLVSDWLSFALRFQFALEEYLKTGGFPLALERYLRQREVDESLRQAYLSVLRSDVEKLRRNRGILNSLLARIVITEGSPQSWQNLSKDAGIGSPNTAIDYVEILGDSFLLFVLQALDRNRKAAEPKKDKKIYFCDPLVRDAISKDLGLPGLPLEHKVEAAVGFHLIRLFEKNPEEGLSHLNKVYYWRNVKGKEVDFVALYEKGVLPLEVKFQESINKEDYSLIQRSFGSGVVVTKNVLERREGILFLPAALFLQME